MTMSSRLSLLRVRPLAGNRARGWLTAGPFRVPCALGRPDRVQLRSAGAPLKLMRRDQGWCEDPSSPRYNRPVRLPAADCTDRMWRDDHLYDLTFVLDQNFSRRSNGRGSAIFFHIARLGLTPTAGCVAISAADMLKLAPRLARGAIMAIG
jgi:L,D-peptidoglycan transpeptidase YkuD (ErfK/YbiS/YcfS/YnhG family)